MRISRRSFLKKTAFTSSLLAIGNLSCRQDKKSTNSEKPNIIIIYADDLGYGDLSCFGGDIPTPNIDSIAKTGILFTDFYVSTPVCTPSRYSLLTGRYAQRTKHGLGPDKVIGPGDSHHLDKSELTIAEMLKKIGYKTAIFGKWHLGSKEKQHFPMYHGFDVFSGHIYGCVDYFNHVYGSLGDTWFINNKLANEDGYATDLITNYAISFIDQCKET
ncbi:MAG: sulfatase-like hydrolase/transferase, partial [Planctomycetota bacterium]